MRKLKLLLHYYLLIATTTLFALPHSSFYCITLNSVDLRGQAAIPNDIQSVTYDQIIHLLEEIEEGDLENKCSPEQLEQINQFLALLAVQGILPIL